MTGLDPSRQDALIDVLARAETLLEALDPAARAAHCKGPESLPNHPYRNVAAQLVRPTGRVRAVPPAT
jgi:hypothetical protein